jgi:UDP-glucose 4-epimerase
MSKAKRLMVTGGEGFLGKAFCNLFAAEDVELFVVSRNESPDAGNHYAVDLTRPLDVNAAVRDIQPTHVINFASKGVTRDQSTLADLLSVNVIGAQNLLNAISAAGCTPKVTMFGTAYEYEQSDDPIDEKHLLSPKSPYAISKTTLSYVLTQYSESFPIDYLRLFNIYGPGEPKERLIPYLIERARANQVVALTAGEQLRDFMFVGDLMKILGDLLSAPAQMGQVRVINVGTGRANSVKEFVELAASVLQEHGLPVKLDLGAIPYRLADPMRCVADNSRLVSLIGTPSITDLRTGIELTIKELL